MQNRSKIINHFVSSFFIFFMTSRAMDTLPSDLNKAIVGHIIEESKNLHEELSSYTILRSISKKFASLIPKLTINELFIVDRAKKYHMNPIKVALLANMQKCTLGKFVYETNRTESPKIAKEYLVLASTTEQNDTVVSLVLQRLFSADDNYGVYSVGGEGYRNIVINGQYEHLLNNLIQHHYLSTLSVLLKAHYPTAFYDHRDVPEYTWMGKDKAVQVLESLSGTSENYEKALKIVSLFDQHHQALPLTR